MDIKHQHVGNIIFSTVTDNTALTVRLKLTTTPLGTDPTTTAALLLLCDVITSGAGTFSKEAFIEAQKNIGFSIGVSTSTGRFSVYMEGPHTHYKKALSLLTTMLTKATLSPNEFKRAKATLHNQLTAACEDARAIAHHNLTNTLFDASSSIYTHHPRVVQHALSSVTNTTLRTLYKTLTTSFAYATVGSNESAILETIPFLKKLPTRKRDIIPAPTKLATNPKKLVSEKIQSKQNIEYSIGSAVPLTLFDADMPALYFGLSVLGKWGGFSGRLMSTVREKEGLTYGIYCGLEGITPHTTGYFRIMTFFSPKDSPRGVTSTLREVSNIIESGITDEEHSRFATILKTQDVLVFDSLAKVTNLLHTLTISGLTMDMYTEYRHKIHTVTKEAVNTALRTYLSPDTLTISIAGPVSSVIPDLTKLLRS